MNGAQALIRTLVDCGVDTCFTNPGTSEMHFVAALDAVPEMRGVLALFEGVATGAADGYARMADRPAATLLHLGPGPRQRPREPAQRAQGPRPDRQHRRRPRDLPQALRRAARVRHRDRRAQRARAGSARSQRASDAGADAADAVAAALGPPGQVATLILPADVCWLDGGVVALPHRRRRSRDRRTTRSSRPSRRALRSGEPAALFLGGSALRERGLVAASRVANATGAKLLCETFPTRLERGAGLPAGRAPRLPRRVRARSSSRACGT